MGGEGPAVVEAAGSTTSGASAGRAAARGAIRVRTASARRPSSATTAARPTRIKPPVNALTPATMSVVPRVNSLIGMPNPIAAMPTAASTIPNKDKITDMLTPRLYALPRPATNVARPPPNPILINTGRDEPTRTRAGWVTPLVANAFKPAG